MCLDKIFEYFSSDIKRAEKEAYKERAIELARVKGRRRAEKEYKDVLEYRPEMHR